MFGGGSRATVAITLLVRNPDRPGPAKIIYADIGDYLSREEKLEKVAACGAVSGLETKVIVPNVHGDWLNQRRVDFDSYFPMWETTGLGGFSLASRGLTTNRDAWVYQWSAVSLERNVRRLVETYQRDLGAMSYEQATKDAREISWSRKLVTRFKRGRTLDFNEQAQRFALYRPFTRSFVYFDPDLNEDRRQVPRTFPRDSTRNPSIVVSGAYPTVPFATLMVDRAPDLNFFTACQFFARYRYEPVAEEGTLDLGAGSLGDAVDGFRRIDNVTDEALKRFAAAYGEVSKDDIFFYVYGLLHSPQYREIYAADLKKMLPRIPLVEDPWPFVEAGRKLAELHLAYESVTPYPLDGLDTMPPAPEDPYEFYRVQKMAFAKVRDPETKKLVADKTSVVYSSRITLSGIPDAAHRYQLGSRSAIEWILDRYQVKTDTASGIVNDPNDWAREVSDPRYIIDLLARIVTVSLETMAIVDALPALAIREDQNPA